jgi:hypothetical protein
MQIALLQEQEKLYVCTVSKNSTYYLYYYKNGRWASGATTVSPRADTLGPPHTPLPRRRAMLAPRSAYSQLLPYGS